MKVRNTPISWIISEGMRLDPGPFVSSAFEARKTLELMSTEKQPLRAITSGHKGGIYNGPKFGRTYIHNPEHSVPFLTTTSMMQSDLSRLARLRKRDAISPKLSFLELKKGMILISCSGTVGRMAYAGDTLDGVWSNQDMLKVVVDESIIGSGYLYSFFNSRFGVPLIISGTYGAMIKHLEPEHIQDMPIPRLGKCVEGEADFLIKDAARLRAEFQAKINQATDLLFESAGLKDITPYEWHNQGADTGYSVTLKSSRSIRALNFNSRYQYLIETLKSVEHKTLGEICEGGLLSRGGRFKRVDASPKYGIKLIGQKQGFWAKPEGRWIAPKYAKDEIVVSDETVLIASQGTLGEREVFCRPIFATGKWLEFGYSEHFLRVFSNDPDVSGAYLFAFLRSETAFRCLRSMSIGSKQQDIHVGMLSELPVPIIDEKNKAKVEALIREAFIAKDSADEKEKQAITLVEDAIAEAVK